MKILYINMSYITGSAISILTKKCDELKAKDDKDQVSNLIILYKKLEEMFSPVLFVIFTLSTILIVLISFSVVSIVKEGLY